ncbi:hypothetical protein LCGC14_3038910 [marine sediment metagenome]|uniref:Uncharacterized protein n=1 Tax=marine sediment metagenome TaxID=412755 RepID=A0A0F8ZG54_9ZZZZ
MTSQLMRKTINLIENAGTDRTEMSTLDNLNAQFRPTTIRLNWNQALALNLIHGDHPSSNMPGVFKTEKISEEAYELTVYDLKKFLEYKWTRISGEPFSNNTVTRIYNNLVRKLAGSNAPLWIQEYPVQGTY